MDAAWRQMTRPFCLWYVFLPQRCTHLPQVEIFFLVPFLGSSLEYFVAPFPSRLPSLPLFLLLYANFLKPVPHAIFRKAAGAAARIKKEGTRRQSFPALPPSRLGNQQRPSDRRTTAAKEPSHFAHTANRRCSSDGREEERGRAHSRTRPPSGANLSGKGRITSDGGKPPRRPSHQALNMPSTL